MTATGALSGKIGIGGKLYTFKGTIGSDGAAAIVIPRTGLPNIVGTIHLALAAGTLGGFQLTGQFTTDGSSHAIDGQRYPAFTTGAPAPQTGKYTLAMRAPPESDAALEPGGKRCQALFGEKMPGIVCDHEV